MNIFFIHPDPDIAAEQLCDKHVVKMIVESAQLLSTAHRVLDGRHQIIERSTQKADGKITKRKVTQYKLPDERDSVLYAASHMNHPSGLWCRTSIENYYWLFHHMDTMMTEYTYRYDKVHSTARLLPFLQDHPRNLTRTGMTPAPSCMPEDCKVGDVFTNYREYYNKYKRHIFNWKKRPVPSWIIS